MAVPKNFSRYICMWLSVWHISIQTVTSEEDLLLARPDKVLRRRFLQQNLQSPRQHRRSDFDGIGFVRDLEENYTLVLAQW